MVYQDYILGKIKVRYILDEASEHISIVLLPKERNDCYDERRQTLEHRNNVCSAWNVGSLCHLALRHHAQGNGAGNTLKYGYSTEILRFRSQQRIEAAGTIQIITLLEAPEGYGIKHIVTYTSAEDGLEIETVFVNQTGKTVIVDMITSFCLDNLSPFQKDDAPYKLKLHRFRGGWSLEGKHQEDKIENLNLESSWFRAFPESERYGSLGSYPVKRWFPFGCVEDLEHHVFWAAQLASNSSWQMELSRDGDCYSLSGGIADSEFGGWWKAISNGEEFSAPKAYISVSENGLWDVCQNITGMFHKYVDKQPASEQELPILFNEWCTTWGAPSHEGMLKLAERCRELNISYLVIDAGWSKKPVESEDPQAANGDWEYDDKKFPQGLLPLSRQLKEKGFQLGIWMEFEVTTYGAKVHGEIYDSMHLHRNGEIIQTGNIRRFWDFRQAEVVEYLRERVIEFLRENEITYLKVDYNGCIGAGCDGAESLGEGLREQMQAVYDFFVLLRKELPELVIESCASGGHRLEASMMQITSMSSFSDTHECREIPYIAANLHQLILPRQSQIWAVISPEFSISEIQYRLVSAMLGRFCLSGDVVGLNEQQWLEICKAVKFYEHIRHIIKDGRSSLIRECTDNQHHLSGAQVLLREWMEEECILVYHSFEQPPETIEGVLPKGSWTMKDHIGAEPQIKLDGNYFKITPQHSWEAYAIHFVRIPHIDISSVL